MLRNLGFLAAVVLFPLVAWAQDDAAPAGKPLRAGIIATDTSHVIAFTGTINDPKAEGPLADVQVTAAFPSGSPDIPSSWDRVEEYKEGLRSRGVKIVDSIPALLDEVDVVLVEAVDGRPHLEHARAAIEAGKPTYIDKPMAASLADALVIFRLAEEKKVPIFSASSLRFSSGFQAAREGKSFGQVKGCTAWSPMSLEPHHPDLFWYGIHGVETLFTIMGPGCETVTRVGPEEVRGVWKDGRVGTFVAKKGYGATVEGTTGSGEAGTFEGYKPMVVEMCRFFRTGVSPVPKEETIEILAFMEAADESKRRGGQPVSMQEIIERAQQDAASR